MATISFIVSGSGTINAFANGRQYVIPRTHKNYQRAKEALKTNDADTFVRAVDYQERLNTFVPAGRKVEVRGGSVYLDGQELHNVVTERILALEAEGFPWGPVGNFLENVQQNPSYRAIQELYKFLEHRVLPITDNGHFLAYKAVRHDWTDKHSRTFDNSVGKVVRMPRNAVNDDAREGCSTGLHVGSIEYVNGFREPGDHVVICRVNPRDVVSVPFDAGCTKLRCCEYEVVGEYTGDLTELVYTSQGDAVPPPSRNDPTQGVTQAPPPRDAGGWAGVDPGAQEGDKTVVSEISFGPEDFSSADFSADDVGLGPKDDDEDEDPNEVAEEYSDLEDDLYENDEDEEDLDDDEDGFDSALEEFEDVVSDLYDQDDATTEIEFPVAEAVEGDDGEVPAAYPYEFNREYDDAPEILGGES
jgi:hypothetical protein